MSWTVRRHEEDSAALAKWKDKKTDVSEKLALVRKQLENIEPVLLVELSAKLHVPIDGSSHLKA